MTRKVIYFDYLRVFAIISVIILHVSSQNWETFDGQTFTWNVFNFYDGIVRWGVPIFVMISGSLFLSTEIKINKLYKKNILKMFIAYLVWSIFYAVMVPLFSKNIEFSFWSVLINIINGHYHMWFIPMIIGLYICIPIIKEITKLESTTKYFLVISFVFAFLIPQLINISNDFIGGFLTIIINEISKVINNDMKLYLVLGFPFYFILGYWLNKIELTKKQRKIIYILGFFGFISTVVLNSIVAWNTNEPCQTYYDNFSINVLLEAITIYIWFKYKEYSNNKLNSIISKLAKYSFGAYWIHVFIIIVLNEIGINTLMCSPIISIPIISFITIIISFIISSIINKIPIINKYIV